MPATVLWREVEPQTVEDCIFFVDVYQGRHLAAWETLSLPILQKICRRIWASTGGSGGAEGANCDPNLLLKEFNLQIQQMQI